MARERHDWGGRPVLHKDHVAELEARSADLEFKDRLSRDNAESQAYREYRKKHHTASAAHHLRGMKSANASGDVDEARKHGAMYEMHMSKLGDDPWKEPSPELKAAMGAVDREPAHKFKAHAGDQFVADEHQAKKAGETVAKALPLLYLKAKVADILQKAEPGAAPPPGMVSPPIQNRLHSTVEGFMGGLKALPKGSPARGKFITSHMGHAPFVAALQAHPQGKQVHQMLMGHLNSAANAGFKPGSTVATAKAEDILLSIFETLEKAWPKDDAENAANTGAHHVFTDALESAGAKVYAGKDLPSTLDYKNPIKWAGPGAPATRTRVTAAGRSQSRNATRIGYEHQPAATMPTLAEGAPLKNKPVINDANDFTGRGEHVGRIARQNDKKFWEEVDTASIPRAEPKLIGKVDGQGGHNVYDYSHLLSPEMRAQGYRAQIHNTPGSYDNFMQARLIDPQGNVSASASAYPGTSHTEAAAKAPALAPIIQHHQSWIHHVANDQGGVTVTRKSESSAPIYRPAQLVHDGDRNLIVVKVHEGKSPGDQHLYTLRDPVDNSITHAFESRLEPSKEEK